MKRSPVSATARPLESHAPQPTAPSRAEAVLRWLVPLRFLSAAGQTAALAIAGATDLPLPYGRLWIVPALVVLTNLAWMALRGRSRATAAQLVVPTLVFDAALFTLLLQWTGGPDSPFSALYIIQIVLAAMTGSRGATAIVAFACAAFYALVFPWSAPAHFWHAPAFSGSSIGLHALGMWVAVVVVAAVMTFFMTRIIETLGEREDEMRQLGELAARNARLASLTTLAAGAAHELGSPLGTIAVIARELERGALASGSSAAQAGLAEDAKLLRTEVERCRAILDRMRARAAHEIRESERPIAASELESALREGLDPAEADRVHIAVHAPPATPVGARVDFCEVVGPILRNALDASAAGGPVDVEVRLDAGRLEARVRDRGTGMDELTLRHVGEPFFTTRAPGQGTGLGLFVVHLHLERLGGSLRFESTPGEGTTALVAWPIAGAAGGGSFGDAAATVRDVA